jgi:hypothetical protein
MNASELLKAAGPEQTLQIVTWTQKDTREAFQTALYQIGAQRKLRPQYFQGKSRQEQAKWLADYLTWKNFDGVAEQILQLWLLKAKVSMLTAFLDTVGIKHDGKGQVDDLPDELDAEKVNEGVDAMLKDNSPAEVAIYLQLFQKQKAGGWPAITEALEKRKELKLGA